MSAANAIDPEALARKLGVPVEGVRHSLRFRQVSTLYPHLVALAYDRDLARAAADSDEQIAARVAAWEREQGVEPRDWRAIGAEERDEEEGSWGAETLSPRAVRLVDAWDALLDALVVLEESELSPARWEELGDALMTTAVMVRCRARDCTVPLGGELEGGAA